MLSTLTINAELRSLLNTVALPLTEASKKRINTVLKKQHNAK